MLSLLCMKHVVRFLFASVLFPSLLGTFATAQAFGQRPLQGRVSSLTCEELLTPSYDAVIAKLRRVIPVALTKDNDSLASALFEVDRITPVGKDISVPMKEILIAFDDLPDFHPNSLKLFIRHKEVLKKIRDGYNIEVREISRMVEQSKKEGHTLRAMAQDASAMRRALGLKYKNMTPLALRAEIYGRNIQRYNDALGPTFENLVKELVASGKTTDEAYAQIIVKAQSPNTRLNKLLEVLATVTAD